MCRYYCNAQLGLTQWERPTATAVASVPAVTSAATTAAFIPSTTFSGARSGYVFKAGPSGVGYYIDKGPMATPSDTGIGPAINTPASQSLRGAAVDEEERGPRKSRQEVIAERQAARNAALAQRGGRAKRGGDELDPMDPVSYCCSDQLIGELSAVVQPPTDLPTCSLR